MIKNVLLFLISLSSFELLSQDFRTGQFSIPRISPGWDLGKPSSVYNQLKGNVLHFVIEDSTYAIVIKDSRGDIWHRSVYDFDANMIFSVGTFLDYWIHRFDTITGSSSFYQSQNSAIKHFYTGLTVEPGREIFKGFSCYKIKMVSRDYGKLTLLATDQIIIPSTGKEPYHQTNLLDSVVILKAVYEYDEGTLEASIDTFYSTVQNPEWLLPEQEGAITMEEYKSLKFQEVLQSSNSQQEKKGDNLDIGISLFESRVLSKYDIESHLENNNDVDKLFWMNKSEHLSRTISYDSLISIWKNVGLISPSIVQQIDRYKMRRWKESREKFFTMMTLLMLNEMVNDRNNRETIIANMAVEGYPFRPGSEIIKTDFLNGNVDVSSLFLAVQGMHPVAPFFKTKAKEKIENAVRNLLVMVFPELADEVEVWLSLDSANRYIHVSTSKFTYRTEIYREYQWDEEGNEKPLKKLKEFTFDAVFLSDFERVLKQMGADYHRGKIFGFRSFADRLVGMQTKDYTFITKAHPELALFKRPWYVGALDINMASWLADIKISYKSSDLAYYQSHFNSLYSCSSLVEYLSSEKKINVIEFMRRHQEDLNLSDEIIRTIEVGLQDELIEISDEIARFIPGIQYTVSRLDDPYLSQVPSNMYFSDYFPGVYAFIRQDFNPMLTGLSDDSSEMYCKDDTGMIDTIPLNFHTTEESILAYLHIKLKPTGYGIYTMPSLRLTAKQYYYLTQVQKKELEAILDQRLVGIR